MKYQILRFFVPTIALFVIALNIYMISATNHTRWRGGGFGMYSEVHWSKHEVWFDNVPTEIDLVNLYHPLCDKIRRNPSDKNLKELGQKIKEEHGLKGFTIEAWKLSFDQKDFRLTKNKVHELYIE